MPDINAKHTLASSPNNRKIAWVVMKSHENTNGSPIASFAKEKEAFGFVDRLRSTTAITSSIEYWVTSIIHYD